MHFSCLKRIGAVAAALILCIGAAVASPKGLVSFKTFVPAGPVVQGDSVLVCYILDATHYSIDGFDGRMDGGTLISVNVEQGESGSPGIHKAIVNALFRVTSAGELTAYPMSATVGGETVRSDTVHFQAQPSPYYGEEWETARLFLIEHGAGDTVASLEYKYGSKALRAFSDPVGKSFAIVASKEYQPYIKDPVLAFGVGNSMWNGIDRQHDNSVYYIISKYESDLEGFKERGMVYRSKPLENYRPAHRELAPLLGDIKYAQYGPFNKYFPCDRFEGRDSACLAGCGPVALAQVLSLHRNPVQPSGTATLATTGGKSAVVKLQDHPVRFDGSEDDVANLIIDCAASVGANPGVGGTSSSLSDFKAALIDNWSFSPLCAYHKDIPDYEMLRKIYTELDAGRPVIVADHAHIFVVDGYFRDFIHLNLGWEGYCNGYYRAIVVPDLEIRQLPFREVLTGIRPPAKKEMATVKVTVKKPGTLAKRLPAKKRATASRLVVSGPLGGGDLDLLRTMAGGTSIDGQNGGGKYQLTELDLSGATIVGGEPYAVAPGDGVVIYGQAVKGGKTLDYRYNLSDLTREDWNTIVEWGIDKAPGMNLTLDSEGRVCLVLVAEDNKAGSFLFDSCDNLRTLVLPRRLSAVESNAIIDCRALEKVVNLPSKSPQNAVSHCPRVGR